MEAGQLVPNDIVIGMIRERITRPDADNGFILDGFPRTLIQAEALDDLLFELGRPIDAVLQFNVDFDLLMQRMVGRLTCTSCGSLYNIFSKPPTIDDECDECGGKLHHRADDNEETIDRRLRIYQMQTEAISELYQRQGKLHLIDAHGSIDDVTKRVKSALRGMRPRRFNLKSSQVLQGQAKSANGKAEIIRTQIDEPERVPQKPKRESQAVPDESAFVKKPETATTKPANIDTRKPGAAAAANSVEKKPAKKRASTKKKAPATAHPPEADNVGIKVVPVTSGMNEDTPEAELGEKLKSLQDELKAVQNELKRAKAEEKILIARDRKAAAALKKRS
jgi:adenylate kinase